MAFGAAWQGTHEDSSAREQLTSLVTYTGLALVTALVAGAILL